MYLFNIEELRDAVNDRRRPNSNFHFVWMSIFQSLFANRVHWHHMPREG